ncbi:MAG: FKBP-type peptidyl-prolyl cis-trans isomerase [Bdellovibrionota bacterium]
MKRRVFAIQYILKSTSGEVLDASEKDQPLTFLEGSGQIIPALETEIKELLEGEKKKVKLSAENAYGLPEEKMKMQVPAAELSHIPDLKVGSYLRLELDSQNKVVRVTEVTAESITLDGNHPLAGQALEFDIEMILVREATSEELSHGHAHGLHGHSHH